MCICVIGEEKSKKKKERVLLDKTLLVTNITGLSKKTKGMYWSYLRCPEMKLASDQAGSKGSHENDISDFSLSVSHFPSLPSVFWPHSFLLEMSFSMAPRKIPKWNFRLTRSHSATTVEREHLSFHAQK